MPSSTAALSSWISMAKRGCTEPWPRLGPQAGLLVYARVLSKRYEPKSYGAHSSWPE